MFMLSSPMYLLLITTDIVFTIVFHNFAAIIHSVTTSLALALVWNILFNIFHLGTVASVLLVDNRRGVGEEGKLPFFQKELS